MKGEVVDREEFRSPEPTEEGGERGFERWYLGGPEQLEKERESKSAGDAWGEKW